MEADFAHLWVLPPALWSKTQSTHAAARVAAALPAARGEAAAAVLLGGADGGVAFFALLAALSLANGAVLYGARRRLQRMAGASHERQPLTQQTSSGDSSPQEEGLDLDAGAGAADRKQDV